jgi:mannitol/fructose-specific phosphotransferase system IIA component (Ntr-type)
MGVVTSKLLCYKLTNEIPEIEIVKVGSVKDLQDSNLTQKVDLIISTVPLSGIKIPFVTVSPLLRQEDQKLIKEALKLGKGENAWISNSQTLLNNMLIFLQVSATSSKEVIELLGNALLNSGFVKEGFVKEVLRREKKYPTGMSTEIPMAIPHAGPEFTIKKGIALATLKFPVQFRNMGDPNKLLDVRIVLIPALTGNEEDGREFYEILERLKDRKVAEELLKYDSKEKIKRILLR